MKTFYCSSSIANFKQGLQRKYPHAQWPRLGNYGTPAVFFGMYHIMDVLRLVWHKNSIVVWCGSDIVNMQKNSFLLGIVLGCNERHICENEIERKALEKLGIHAEIKPQLFDVVQATTAFPLNDGKVHAYLCAHEGRELEYGVWEIEDVAAQVPHVEFHIYGIQGKSKHQNVRYYGKVSQKQFLDDTKNYHVAIRLNAFDGFSEILARSALFGQYQISRILYPHMYFAPTKEIVKSCLQELSNVREPNYAGRNYWSEELNKSLI